MRILHYALGFPPYRTGGLTKYCIDLMITQKEQGHEVALLWPGQMGIIDKKLRIREGNDWNGIKNFEIINSLPVALDEGIKDIDAYTISADKMIYRKLLLKLDPDIIHIHTLMGLHKEVLDVAQEFGIYTVFTSHDYYGICPKVTLFHDGVTCDDDHGCKDCVKCNQSALDIKTIIQMQSPIYRIMKDKALVKKIRQIHRSKFFEEKKVEPEFPENVNELKIEYQKLRSYYVTMLEQIDFIHFNSNLSESIYRRYIKPKKSKIISVTHRDIIDHRKIKCFAHEKLLLTYLGPPKPFKGFQFLLSVLDNLWGQGIQNFELHIYTSTPVQRKYITYRQNGYTYRQLEEIFDNTDLLIVPSRWYETFGFTVLEALSYGVPVLPSNNVGAKDLLNTQYDLSTEKKFIDTIKTFVLGKSQLSDYNLEIVKYFDIDTMAEHCRKLMTSYI